MGEAKRKALLSNRTFVDADDLNAHAPHLLNDLIHTIGRLLYRAQLLDLLFRVVHVLLDAKRDGLSSSDIYEWLNPENALTMGEVYSELLKRRYLLPGQKNLLKLAINERNLLVHDSFKRRAMPELLLTPGDRETLTRRVGCAYRRINRAIVLLANIGKSITDNTDSRSVGVALSEIFLFLTEQPEIKMKPIYQILGIAQVTSQNLESMLRLSLVGIDDSLEATTSLAHHPVSELSVTQVINNLQREMVFDDQQVAQLREAIFARNKLMHFPWHMVTKNLADPEKYKQLEKHLQRYAALIWHANKSIGSHLFRHGVLSQSLE